MKTKCLHDKGSSYAMHKSITFKLISRTFLFILISFLDFVNTGKAQVTVTGKIIDAVSRQSLAAATIAEDNNQKHSALTDQDGNFLMQVNNANSTIVASFIGYQSTVFNISGQKSIRIEMKSSAVSLKDIVIDNKSVQQKFSTLAKVDLDLHPVRNTQELMRIVPGLFVAQHAGGGKAEQIFLRGFDCDHGTDIQVSVDGLPVNMVSHAHGQGYADSHFIIPETINNIDYGTGPYHTQHGNLNTAGYVSFSTYNNIARSQVQVEAGRYNTFR
ncbi:MAG: TonB-dependent receptor plug domain-containing protein, partial [Ginsengibacter sp.]